MQFAHCYKNQGGWEQVLGRFPRGGGTLLDLEFLSENGRRVAAFGYHAGFAGAALAIRAWGWQQLHGAEEKMPGVKPYSNEQQLLDEIKHALQEGVAKCGRQPRVLVIGALGRCGRGAVELCEKVGITSDNIVQWDLAETSENQGRTWRLWRATFSSIASISLRRSHRSLMQRALLHRSEGSRLCATSRVIQQTRTILFQSMTSTRHLITQQWRSL